MITILTDGVIFVFLGTIPSLAVTLTSEFNQKFLRSRRHAVYLYSDAVRCSQELTVAALGKGYFC